MPGLSYTYRQRVVSCTPIGRGLCCVLCRQRVVVYYTPLYVCYGSDSVAGHGYASVVLCHVLCIVIYADYAMCSYVL